MINVVVSGLGRIAWRYHLPLIWRDERFNLLAISDPMEERRKEAEAEYPGIRTYADFDEMIANEKTADMAVIASPTTFHKPQSITALENGLAVFLEKPMCESYQAACELAEAVRRTNGKLLLYQPNRNRTEFVAFQQLVRPKLGEIRHSRRNVVRFNRRNDWQSRTDCGGGMLNNYGAHYVDQFMAAFGGPVKIKGTILQRTVSIGDAEDMVNILLESASGVTGCININMGCPEIDDSWQVCGTLGSARYSSSTGTWEVMYVEPGTLSDPGLQETLAAQDRAYSLEGEIPWTKASIPVNSVREPYYYDYVYDYFTGKQAPFISLEESMELMRLLDVCRRNADGEQK